MGSTYTCNDHDRHLIISQIHSQKMDNIKLRQAANHHVPNHAVPYLEPTTVSHLVWCTKTEQARAVHTQNAHKHHTKRGSQSVPRVEDRLAPCLVDAIAQMHLSHHPSGVPAGTLPCLSTEVLQVLQWACI